jgi:hypothetical protein
VWVNWGEHYSTRSTGAGSKSYFRYVLDTASWSVDAQDNYAYHLVPCFSI